MHKTLVKEIPSNGVILRLNPRGFMENVCSQVRVISTRIEVVEYISSNVGVILPNITEGRGKDGENGGRGVRTRVGRCCMFVTSLVDECW